MFNSTSFKAVLVLILFMAIAACAPDSYYTPASTVRTSSGQRLSQSGQIGKKLFVYGGSVPSPGTRLSSHPNCITGEVESDGFGGYYVTLYPTKGFRWVNNARTNYAVVLAN